MGAWGPGSFENDDALDWVAELEESKDLSPVARSIDAVLDSLNGYPEAPDCAAALAAIEIVAALLGNASSALPHQVVQWLGDYGHQSVGVDIVSRATDAVNTMLLKSELRALWQESDLYAEWRSELTDLLLRLTPKPHNEAR